MLAYKRNGLYSMPTLVYERANDGILIHSIVESVDYMYHDKLTHRERGKSLDLITLTKNNNGCKTTTDQNIRTVIYTYPTLRPLRCHKKRRIAKKYMKKYGFIAEHIAGINQSITEVGDAVYFMPEIPDGGLDI